MTDNQTLASPTFTGTPTPISNKDLQLILLNARILVSAIEAAIARQGG